MTSTALPLADETLIGPTTTSSSVSVPQALHYGATGAQVTTIQTSLLQQGAEIDSNEIINTEYGFTTRSGVLEFQKKHHLPPTGVVDETTALLLLQTTDELESPKSFIYGTITQPNGSAGANLTVRISNRDLRKEYTIVTVKSNASGLYHCSYHLKHKREDSPAVNLVVRVFHDEQLLYEPTTTQIIFNAPTVAIVPITLTTGDTFILDQYTTNLSKTRSLLKHQDVQLDELQEDDKRQDITYLNQETKIPSTQLINLVVAHKLAAKSSIEPDFFYAILLSNSFAISSQTDVTGMRPAVGLNSNLQTILYDIVLSTPDSVTSTVKQAVTSNLVPKSLVDKLPSIQKTLTKWTRAAQDYLKKNPAQTQITEQLGQLYNDGKIDSLFQLLQQRNYGDLSSVVSAIDDIFSTPLSSQFPSTLSAPAIASIAPETQPSASKTEPTEAETTFADTGEQPIEASSHTKLFAKQLKNSKKPVFGEHDSAILQLLEKNTNFDLASGGVDALFEGSSPANTSSTSKGSKSTTDHKAAAQTLKSIQRVFKLSPSLTHTKALLDGGLKSSFHIQALGKTQFLKKFASKPEHAFTPDEGKAIFRKAEDMHLATTLLAGNIQTASSAVTIPAISSSIQNKQIQAITQSFPNMTSLFQQGDVCSCDDCMTVTSASAYLVDVLDWIGNRTVINTQTGTAPTAGPALTVLFNRRPDLGDVDLSCANTNTTMPYIDYVCELLENAVVADPTSTLPDTLTSGPVSAALLADLKNLGYAFTPQAAVSDADMSGNRIIRDPNLVVKAVLIATGGWTLRLLRQSSQSSDQLAAAPEYVNQTAYQTLSSADYAFSLPFDLNHEESASYFQQFGIKRSYLMRILKISGSSPTDVDIAAEELNITSDELNLITTPNTAQEQFWKPAQPADMPPPAAGTPLLQIINNVEVFVDTANITYPQLQSLLSLGQQAAQVSWLDLGNYMFIKHLDTSCNLREKVISGLDTNGLDRIHRFIRLWLKLQPAGWDFSTLDQAIFAPKIGNNVLDTICVLNISQLEYIRHHIGITVMNPSDCLYLFADLPLILTNSSYANVFLNAAKVGIVDTDFLPDNVIKNQNNEATTPGSGLQIIKKQAYLALALGRTTSDIGLLLQALPSHGNEILSDDSISSIYASHLFALRSGLTISDFLTLQQFVSLQPTSSPENAVKFLERLKSLRSSGLSVDDLNYYLQYQSLTLTQRALSDQVATTVLTSLQTAYFTAVNSATSPFNPQATVTDNIPPLLALAAQLPGFATQDAATLTSVINNNSTTSASDFIDAKFGVFLDATQIHTAQTALSAATSATLASLQMAFINVLDTALSIFNAKYSIVVTTVAQALTVDSSLLVTMLENATVTAAAGETIVRILTDAVLVPASATPPPPTPTTFNAQYRAFRLIYDMNAFASKMSIANTDMQWLLQNSAGQVWMSPGAVKYQSDVPNVTFDSWLALYQLLQLGIQFPAVTNPTNFNVPISLYGFHSLIDTSGTTLSAAMDYLVQLTGWDRPGLDALNTRFGLTLSSYKDPHQMQLFSSVLVALRTMAIDVPTALSLIKPKLLSSDTALLRTALKSLYSDSSWLGVLTNIMNPLRLKKRDALVNYILASNPTFTSSNDLYDYFLIDVEMGFLTSTSRIVQAHATVQLFIQRCLMALEPTSVADVTDDNGWLQWTWMSQYRVWEANRQVFLWPETWIHPELRDNKSEIYVDAENQLQQNQITSLNAEGYLIGYLEALNGISQLDVVALYYQVELRTLHIFGRTKGGDPLIYYYRQLIRETNWTPWTKLNVDIKSDSLVAFSRNGRLSLAWLEIATEQEQVNQAPIPDPSNLGTNPQTPPPRQRLNMRLAISELSLSGAWTPKAVSRNSLYFPPAGSYTLAQEIPPVTDIHVFCWDIGSSGGQTISVTISLDFLNSFPGGQALLEKYEQLYGVDYLVQYYLGSFSLTGCKGYPEPAPQTNRVFFEVLPQFRNCEMSPQNYVKYPASAGPFSPDDYAMKNFYSPYDYEAIYSTVLGNISTAYPMQMTILDWLLLIFGSYRRATERATRTTVRSSQDVQATQRYIIIQPPTISNLDLGTWLPFITNDPTRTWVVIPDLWERIFLPGIKSKLLEDTCADLFDLVDRLVKIIQKYYYPPALSPDFATLVKDILGDSDFTTLVTDAQTLFKRHRGYKFINFYHPLICALISTTNKSGVAGLLALSTQQMTNTYSFDTTYSPTNLVYPIYPVEDISFDLTNSYGSYNWELFFHFPYEVASQLNTAQQFQDAQNWLHYIFNPVGGTGSAPNKYWNMKFFNETTAQDYSNELIDNIMNTIAGDPVSTDPTSSAISSLASAVSDWRNNPFSPHVIARSRPVAYQIAIVLLYVKNLLDWGDSLFGQYTRETITAATQLYILADKLLGPKPQTVPKALPTPVLTYNQLQSKLDIFGNALIDLENIIPPSTLPHGGQELPSPPSGATGPTFSSLYFAIPQNSYVLQYWDTVADRLFKIRNSENINGVFVPLPLFSPPIDPGALVLALASGASLSSILNGLTAPQPIYRFESLVQKAMDFTMHTSNLGNALLSALEKRDAEALAILRSNQQLLVLNAVLSAKQAGIVEAQSALAAVTLSKQSVLERQSYYQSRPYMNAGETLATILSGVSIALDIAVILGYAFGGGAKIAPTFSFGGAGFGGSPLFMASFGGQQIGGSAETIASSLSTAGRSVDKLATIAGQQGSYQRRADDWAFQARLATDDLATVAEQINTATLHVKTLQADLVAHQAAITAEQQANDFMKSKYTNQQLYQWMAGQISSVYYSTYKLAFDAAKVAERALLTELGDNSGTTYISYGYWDSTRSGLLAAESLQSDIKRLISVYQQKNIRYYELTKNISLADLDPFALISLRSTGKCTITVPEEIFDMDHPGHYFRRIKAVSLSIPCVVGPQRSVSAKLTLQTNRYRMNTTLTAADPSNPNPLPQDPYKEQPVGGDPRFIYNVGTVESIALSSAVNDSGMFELNFRDERYLPFENTGAIGTWQLELPTVLQQFDYKSITDVILHIHYTARDGGTPLQSAVEAGQLNMLNLMTVDAQKFGVYQAYELKRQFSTEWTHLLKTNTTQLTVQTRFLPYWLTKQKPVIDSIIWFARVQGDPAQFTITVGSTSPPANNVVLKKQSVLGNLLVSDSQTSGVVVLDTPFTLGLSTPAGSGAQPVLVELLALVHYTFNPSS